jgi:hypothetical protein
MAAFVPATREAKKAGIAHAKAAEPHSYRGRKPSFDRAQLDIIRDLLAQTPARPPSRWRRVCRGKVVYRVRDDPARAEAMLAEWGVWRRTSPTRDLGRRVRRYGQHRFEARVAEMPKEHGLPSSRLQRNERKRGLGRPSCFDTRVA